MRAENVSLIILGTRTHTLLPQLAADLKSSREPEKCCKLIGTSKACLEDIPRVIRALLRWDGQAYRFALG
jgi:hypothetical protein